MTMGHTDHIVVACSLVNTNVTGEFLTLVSNTTVQVLVCIYVYMCAFGLRF